MRKIKSDGLVSKLAEGIGENPQECKRIIIDLQAGDIVKIYVEKYGTDKLLQLSLPDLSDAEITIIS